MNFYFKIIDDFMNPFDYFDIDYNLNNYFLKAHFNYSLFIFILKVI
jgi:hypothetical protein